MAPPSAQNVVAMNNAARQAIIGRALKMRQLIFSQTIATPGQSNNVVTVNPRNVGLITGFWVELSGTLTQAVAQINPTELNVANFLSNVTFYDLNNNLRVNTPGWHLHLLNSVKRRRPFASAFTTDNPCGFGSNLGDNAWIKNPGNLTGGVTGTVRMLYYVPLAYSDRDLRGSIYANVVNATLQLVLTINPNPTVDNASDYTLAMYHTDADASGGTGVLSNVTVNVYQDYYDQLPQVQGKGPFLPILDLSTIYELKSTSLTGLSVNQDFPLPYSNFREFISTMFIMDNGPGAGLNAGTDLNYIALQSANFTNLFKVDPYLLSMLTRQEVMADFPIGVYYVSHRDRPLSTVQYGNMELIVNPSTVNSGAQILIAYEDFAMVNSVTGAGSLPAG